MSENDQEEWPPQLDAVIAAAKNHRVLMEDDAVRVLEVTVDPGERENLHHHRWPSIMVILARPNYVNRDAKGNVILPTGERRRTSCCHGPCGYRRRRRMPSRWMLTRRIASRGSGSSSKPSASLSV